MYTKDQKSLKEKFETTGIFVFSLVLFENIKNKLQNVNNTQKLNTKS